MIYVVILASVMIILALFIVLPFAVRVKIRVEEGRKPLIKLLLLKFIPVTVEPDMKKRPPINLMKVVIVDAFGVRLTADPIRLTRLFKALAFFEALTFGALPVMGVKPSFGTTFLRGAPFVLEIETDVRIKIYAIIKELLWKKRVKSEK